LPIVLYNYAKVIFWRFISYMNVSQIFLRLCSRNLVKSDGISRDSGSG